MPVAESRHDIKGMGHEVLLEMQGRPIEKRSSSPSGGDERGSKGAHAVNDRDIKAGQDAMQNY